MIKKWLRNVISYIVKKCEKVKEREKGDNGQVETTQEVKKTKKVNRVEHDRKYLGLDNKHRNLIAIYYKTKKYRVKKKQVRRICKILNVGRNIRRNGCVKRNSY